MTRDWMLTSLALWPSLLAVGLAALILVRGLTQRARARRVPPTTVERPGGPDGGGD